MVDFCQEQNIPHDVCGKVIVAVDESELPRLDRIHERGLQNGVHSEFIDRERLKEFEPYSEGIRALHVPDAGIVDYRQVALRLAELVTQAGGAIRTGTRVTGIRNGESRVVIEHTGGDVEAHMAVNCAGLFSDRVARLSGVRPDDLIVPFRGEYYELLPEAEHLCRNLIYPVPDPGFPFLGVHFTRMIAGGVECGPNAVLAREGYQKSSLNLYDLAESLTYRGFLRLAAGNWRKGFGELWRSFSKAAFVHALQRLIPEIRSEHLTPAPSGVRAQALRRDGTLNDDFLIIPHGRVVNVCNAPSPAATAALNIGRLIVQRINELG